MRLHDPADYAIVWKMPENIMLLMSRATSIEKYQKRLFSVACISKVHFYTAGYSVHYHGRDSRLK